MRHELGDRRLGMRHANDKLFKVGIVFQVVYSSRVAWSSAAFSPIRQPLLLPLLNQSLLDRKKGTDGARTREAGVGRGPAGRGVLWVMCGKVDPHLLGGSRLLHPKAGQYLTLASATPDGRALGDEGRGERCDGSGGTGYRHDRRRGGRSGSRRAGRRRWRSRGWSSRRNRRRREGCGGSPRRGTRFERWSAWCEFAGTDARLEEGFVGVDVADTGEHTLIEEHGLDVAARAERFAARSGGRSSRASGPSCGPVFVARIERAEDADGASGARSVKSMAIGVAWASRPGDFSLATRASDHST